MATRNRLSLDVSGHIFKVNKDIITKGPESGLTRLIASPEAEELSVLEIDRPAELFSAILAWYQTGELHIPTTSCPRAFLIELEFWEISPELLSSCCGNRLQAFLSEQDTLLNFGHSISNDNAKNCYSNTSLDNFRSKIWEIVDYTRPTLLGKVYFIATLVMILLSIFVLACSTDPRFQRTMTNCERLEYMAATNMDDYDLVKETLEKFCDIDTIPGTPDAMDQYGNLLRDDYNSYYPNEAEFMYVAFTIKPENKTTTPVPLPTYNPYPQSSSPPLQKYASPVEIQKSVKIPNMSVPVNTLFALEVVTIVYFTVDLAIRMFSCPQVGHFFLSVINIADVVALMFTYVHVIWTNVYIHEQYHRNMIDLLDVFQMLRSIRLFRIVSNVKAGRVLAYSLRANTYDLFVLLLFLLSGVCVFSSFLFIVDNGVSIRTIPEGWYWAITTMTTVGYGDIVPVTNLGRFLSCVCMLFGVILFAVTVPIFANNFLTLYQYADVEQHMKSLRKRKLINKETVSTGNQSGAATDGHPEAGLP